MRKEILLPAVAAAGGVVGFAFRRWELATAFEADTGLPIDGAPATMALIVLSVVMAVVLALLCRGKYPAFTGYDQAFQAKGNTAYATAGILSAFLLLADAGLSRADWTEKKPHLSASHCGALARDVRAGALLLTHLNPLYDPQALLDEARRDHPAAELARLGERYRV